MFANKSNKCLQKSNAFNNSNAFTSRSIAHNLSTFPKYLLYESQKNKEEQKKNEKDVNEVFSSKISCFPNSSKFCLKRNTLESKACSTEIAEKDSNSNLHTDRVLEGESEQDELSRITKILKYKHPLKKPCLINKKREINDILFLNEDEINNDEYNSEEPDNMIPTPKSSDMADNMWTNDDSKLCNGCMCRRNEWTDKVYSENEREELMAMLQKKQDDWRSITVTMGRRFPRERKAFERNDDWTIFALHGQYVRPRREREWKHGEPAIIRRKSDFDLPPGSVYYLVNSNSLPATAWDPFLFANPSRDFFIKPNQSYISSYTHPKVRRKLKGDFYAEDPYIECSNNYFLDDKNEAELDFQRISSEDMQSLERMIWMNPEPRFECPYRLYADSKYCLKGCKVSDIGLLMRPGW